jgi:hypothetical protein
VLARSGSRIGHAITRFRNCGAAHLVFVDSNKSFSLLSSLVRRLVSPALAPPRCTLKFSPPCHLYTTYPNNTPDTSPARRGHPIFSPVPTILPPLFRPDPLRLSRLSHYCTVGPTTAPPSRFSDSPLVFAAQYITPYNITSRPRQFRFAAQGEHFGSIDVHHIKRERKGSTLILNCASFLWFFFWFWEKPSSAIVLRSCSFLQHAGPSHSIFFFLKVS